MKQFLLLVLMIAPFLMRAQVTEGEIVYEQVIKIEFDRSKMPEHMRDMEKMIPKEARYKKQLVFNDHETYYQHMEDANAEAAAMQQEGPGMRWQMRMARADEKTYVNLEKMELVQQKDFFDRLFLIKDTVEQRDWKITGEAKTVLDYPVMQAIAMVDSQVVEAWFCPTIPVGGGPEGMAGLPGMVLEASMMAGKVSMTALSVTPREVKKEEIEEPKKGKEVTREEFNQIRKEKMEEMRAQHGGGPGGPGGHRMMIMHGE